MYNNINFYVTISIMVNLCKYKNIIGEPNKGIHTHVFGFALFDLLVIMLAAFLIMKFLKQYVPYMSHSLLFGFVLLVLLLLGDYLHKLFCVGT